MSDTTTSVFTEVEIDVLLDVLGFSSGELGEAEDALMESAKLKIWNEESFTEDEALVVKRAMWYADTHMHRHYMILAAQRLNEHWPQIDMKLDRML